LLRTQRSLPLLPQLAQSLPLRPCMSLVRILSSYGHHTSTFESKCAGQQSGIRVLGVLFAKSFPLLPMISRDLTFPLLQPGEVHKRPRLIHGRQDLPVPSKRALIQSEALSRLSLASSARSDSLRCQTAYLRVEIFRPACFVPM